MPRMSLPDAIVFPSLSTSTTKGNTTMALTNRIMFLIALVALVAAFMTGLIVIIESFETSPIRLAATMISAPGLMGV